jgi:hypothetical protein
MVLIVVSGNPEGKAATIYGLDELRQAGTDTYRNLVAALNVHVYQDGAIKVPSALDHYSVIMDADSTTPHALTMKKK